MQIWIQLIDIFDKPTLAFSFGNLRVGHKIYSSLVKLHVMLLVNIVSLRKVANERINCGSRLNLLVAVKQFLAPNCVKSKVVQSALIQY